MKIALGPTVCVRTWCTISSSVAKGRSRCQASAFISVEVPAQLLIWRYLGTRLPDQRRTHFNLVKTIITIADTRCRERSAPESVVCRGGARRCKITCAFAPMPSGASRMASQLYSRAGLR